MLLTHWAETSWQVHLRGGRCDSFPHEQHRMLSDSGRHWQVDLRGCLRAKRRRMVSAVSTQKLAGQSEGRGEGPWPHRPNIWGVLQAPTSWQVHLRIWGSGPGASPGLCFPSSALLASTSLDAVLCLGLNGGHACLQVNVGRVHSGTSEVLARVRRLHLAGQDVSSAGEAGSG